jgi:lipopolysaccharide/colanic/teichoic acid biosynthesis glycosyltransferase
MFIVEALMTYFASSWALPRDVLLTGSGIALASVFTWRIVFGTAVQHRLGLQSVLFIGYPPAARSLTGFLARHPEIGFTPVGYLDTGDSGADVRVARLGSLGDLEEAVGQHRPDWIVIGGQVGIAAPQVDDLVDLRFSGLHVEDLESFYERTTGRAHAASILPSEPVFAEGLLPNPVNVRLQSIYATLGVLVALPIALPLMGAAALATRVTSRGPVLLRDRRVGLCGHPFTMYRLRVTSSGTGIARLVTELGLDRLPQLWNVLRGDMSLVGPEADRLEFAELLNQAIPLHRWRLLVQPGMIGWAQIHKATDRYGLDVIRRLEYDLYYMKNLSPLLDLFVFLRWVREVLPFSETAET